MAWITIPLAAMIRLATAGPARRDQPPRQLPGQDRGSVRHARMSKRCARHDKGEAHSVANTEDQARDLEALMYDYIIIGAGRAGSVVAARLSEDPSTSVLVLEAGPPDDVPEIAMPAATPTLWTGPLTWDNATVPQRHAAGRVIPWPSGRTLGGSSSINGMIYIRGNRVDLTTGAMATAAPAGAMSMSCPASCAPWISNEVIPATTAPAGRCE